MLTRGRELVAAIKIHSLIEEGSAVASEFPPGWHKLDTIRATHKFVKIESNGDLTFKRDTFWTRMEHKARHVAAFFGVAPLMKL